ncbi:amidase signature enzyme [Patellaria atrata CBS 101060]|uniref:Amidase signature enzyme n=1 Tax=Patellaria atrata CBS 101060 TaxID=1346257 RepID=A0A9P4SAG3_9PEZI|nr:amidase signature enzyme [Patellaria atrata CBS 101060]
MTNQTEYDLEMPLCAGINIEDYSITQLQQALTEGKFTSYELTECHLGRMEVVDELVKAVIDVNPEALLIADRMDKEREEGKVRSLLHGIPFVVKNNIATKDDMQTTAGSTSTIPVLVGATVPKDAEVVTKLRDAGAVLIGNANMSEWAAMRASYYSEGYSSRGGQCRNPYNLAEAPGDSSGGSAVCVATNIATFSLGTETDGSVIYPADRNSVVGLKPTVGLTSTAGVIPESSSLDTVGTFGRFVADAVIALDGISHGLENASYSSFVTTKEALKGARFGLPWKRIWERAKRTSNGKMEYEGLITAIQKIREAGAEVLNNVDLPSAEEIVPPEGSDWDYAAKQGRPEQSEFTVVKTEFYNEIQSYLSGLTSNPHNIKTLEDIIAYNTRHTEKEGGVPGTHPAWPTGQDTFEKSAASKGIKNDNYTNALAYIQKKSRDEGIDAALESQGEPLDGLLVPVQADGGVAVQVAAKAGYPVITIPIGVNENGVPFGLGILQTAHKEDLLIKYGSAIEDLIRGRAKPQFLNIKADNFMFIGIKPE